MIINEFVLKDDINCDGLFAIKKFSNFLEYQKIDYDGYIFKDSSIFNVFSSEKCLKIKEHDFGLIIKSNLFSAVCLKDINFQITDILKKYYKIVKKYEAKSFYLNDIFAGYCISPKSYEIIDSYKTILFMHHDFQNLFLIYKDKN